MFSSIRNKIALNLLNFVGCSIDRKIVVFESDDWGSIRMPSKDVYQKLLKKGIPVDRSPYCKYDSLASEEDLYALFESLSGIMDFQGQNPVFTANIVTANPDFDKIMESDFSEYHYELITKTFQRYPAHSNCLQIWKEGFKSKLFYPQSHGREHLNIPLWLEMLQSGNRDFGIAFKHRCWGLSCDIYPEMERSVQASFDLKETNELALHKELIEEGLQQFEDLIGYRSRSFIANNFIWDPKLNKTLYDCGVKYFQGMKYQKLPLNNKRSRTFVRHYLGEQNDIGQIYLIRNCSFEPSLNPNTYDNVKSCLDSISNAFFWNKPAIISTHRLNYVGFLETSNRNRNLLLLKELLNRMLERWPDIEFMTSVELGETIEKKIDNLPKGKKELLKKIPL